MANKDLYEVLGVNKSANADEIKSAYRKLAKRYHPDVFATADAKAKSDAEAKFKEVQHAYDVLSDTQKKSNYDQFGNEEPAMGGGAGGFNPFGGSGGMGDIFGDLFSSFGGGSGRGRNPNAPQEGDDIEVALTLNFEEACFGIEKEITYSRVEKCKTCSGTGAKNSTSFKTCTKCGGTGRVTVTQRTMFGMMQSEKVCDMCSGKGKIITESCSDCGGRGSFRKQRTIKVNIPAGVDNGQMLTMRNEGHSGVNGGTNGNLIILFKIRNHAFFVRDGVNLNLELPITVSQAILGAKIDIPTLLSPITIEIPEGTQDGTVIRVKNRGIKHLKREANGDLFVKVIVDIPKHLTSKQKKELAELDRILSDAKYEKVEKYQKNLKEMR